jgi:hypothetical protein
VPVVGLASTTAVYVNNHKACAIDAGIVKCWGENDPASPETDVLGTGEDGRFPAPALGVAAGAAAIAISPYTGNYALQAGQIAPWGMNAVGSYVDAITQAISGPPWPTVTAGVTAVSAGSVNECAVIDGAAYCRGLNHHGELGIGSFAGQSAQAPFEWVDFEPVKGLCSGVNAIASGVLASCAIVNGGVKCWGDSPIGPTSSQPVDTIGLQSGVEAIFTSFAIPINLPYDWRADACAIMGGEAWCWGHNNWGQIGDGTTTDATVPTKVIGLPTPVTTMAVSGGHTCAVAAGALYCWGRNNYGQLGDGTTTERHTPTPVTL